MKRMGVYDQVKKALQDIMAPELHGLNAKIDSVNASLGARIDGANASLGAKIDGVNASLSAKIDGVDTKVNALRNETLSMKAELLAEIRRLDGRIDGVEARIGGLDRQLQTAIDIRERLAALEARRPA